jgi:hypothetical protein
VSGSEAFLILHCANHAGFKPEQTRDGVFVAEMGYNPAADHMECRVVALLAAVDIDHHTDLVDNQRLPFLQEIHRREH